MDSNQRSVMLTSAQVRAVSATLRIVEEAVEGIERLLAGPASGFTTWLHDDLDPDERETVENACRRVRAALPTVSRCLGAERSERSLRAKIRGECAVVWAAVQDTRSPGLQGYGPLSSEAAVLVEAALGELEAPLVDILHRLATPFREEAVPSAPWPGLPEDDRSGV